MRPAPLVLSLGLLAACSRGPKSPAPQAPPAPSVSPLVWSARSADGNVVVEQLQDEAGCRVHAVARGAELWSTPTCFAEKHDTVFVSDSGEHVVAIHTYPTLDGGFSDALVVEQWAKGARVSQLPAGALMQDPARARRSRAHAYWVAGVLGSPGRAPSVTEDHQSVELEALDGTHRQIAFDVSAYAPALRAALERAREASAARASSATSLAAAAPSMRGSGFITWEDEDGVHVVSSLDEVPKKYRSTAKRTEDAPPAQGLGSPTTIGDLGGVAPGFPGVQPPVPTAQQQYGLQPESDDHRCDGLSPEECVKRVPSSSALGKRAAAQAAANAAERENRRRHAFGTQPGVPIHLDDRTTPMCGGSDGKPCPGPGPGIP
jgi:hypothetical protein